MKSDEQLLEELETLTAGLLFMSEADYPFQALSWKGSVALTDDYLRDAAARKNSSRV
ncbi:MAG: hypothetical protein ICV60_21220 [Pyrinomonadaceae bacterium]|nr:hypothetical protein [Pyrinomonadaceae bacterium]